MLLRSAELSKGACKGHDLGIVGIKGADRQGSGTLDGVHMLFCMKVLLLMQSGMQV